MTDLAKLLDDWRAFDDAAFRAECRLERMLDAYCDARGPAPDPADVVSCKRLRFIATHRLKWILYQVDRARANVALI